MGFSLFHVYRFLRRRRNCYVVHRTITLRPARAVVVTLLCATARLLARADCFIRTDSTSAADRAGGAFYAADLLTVGMRNDGLAIDHQSRCYANQQCWLSQQAALL